MADASKRAEGVPGRDDGQPARAVRQLVPRQPARNRSRKPVAEDQLAGRLLRGWERHESEHWLLCCRGRVFASSI